MTCVHCETQQSSTQLRNRTDVLVLQSHLCGALTTVDVGAFRLRLVTATPSGPVQDVRRQRWRLPYERKEPPPHLWDCQRQELGGHEAHGLAYGCACCFLFVRPLCRPR